MSNKDEKKKKNKNKNKNKNAAKRPTIKRESARSRHKRNPSIHTLMKTKRYQQATPKHEMMEQVFFSPHGDDIFTPNVDGIADLELEAKMAPKIERLESVINRLRIENSHAMSKSNDLQSKNALLQRTLKHSKQQYALIENENKKLKMNNKYLKDRLNELKSKNRDDDDIMSVVSLRSQITNMMDTHRKGAVKQKKIKKSLEDVINDPGLPSNLRTKLVMLLPNFYTNTENENDEPSYMKLDILSDHDHSPPLSPVGIEPHIPIWEDVTENDIIPDNKPTLITSQTFDKKTKLINYKKRKVKNGHNRNLSLAPKITITKPNNNNSSHHQRSSSSNSYRSSQSNYSDEIYIMDDSESEHDDEEKEVNLRRNININTNTNTNTNTGGIAIIPQLNTTTSFESTTSNSIKSIKSYHKSPPSPQPRGSRPKPPPPPRNHKNKPSKRHTKNTQSDSLTKMKKKGKNMQHLNLSEIEEMKEDSPKSKRVRSVSHDVRSPSTTSTTDGIKGSPTKSMANLILDVEDGHFYHKQNNKYKPSKKIAKEKRAMYQRNKANTTAFAFENGTKHRRSKSHQRFGSFMNGNESDSDFSTDNENIFDPYEAKRNKFFRVDLGWRKKRNDTDSNKKKRRESIKVSKKEERNLAERRSILRKEINNNNNSNNNNKHTNNHKNLFPNITSKRNSSFNEPLINISSDLKIKNHTTQLTRSSSANPPQIRNNQKQKQYSSSAQISRNKNKKKKKKKENNDNHINMTMLAMSKTSSADNDSIANSPNSYGSEIMTVNPLSPVKDIDNNNINNLFSPNIERLSVSKPNSPMLNPMKPPRNNKSRKSIPQDDIGIIGRNLISGGLLGMDNPLNTQNKKKNNDNNKKKKKTKKTHSSKSSSLQLTKNISKDYYRNKYADNGGGIKHKKSREDIAKTVPQKPIPINNKRNSRTTRMDQIRKEKLSQSSDSKKRYSSPSIVIAKSLQDSKLSRVTSHESNDSPIIPNVKRRSSFSIKRRKKTDHFEINNKDKEDKIVRPQRGRRSNHSRSMSLRGGKFDRMSFSVSPQPNHYRKDKDKEESSPERKRKKYSMHFSQKRRGTVSSIFSSDTSDDDNDINKVWTLKDLIREMVSNGYDTNHVRNALILSHTSFTTSVELFEELRRFFRMSITQMTSTILWFEDDDDDKYISSDDRRWFMRQKITQCILYWIKQYWIEDFSKNKQLQSKVELFKGDIRSAIHDINRSKQLIEPLMETLTFIANKYGGINPKNLNLPKKKTKNNTLEIEKKEDENVFTHPSDADNDDADDEYDSGGGGGGDNGTVIDGSFRRKKKIKKLMSQQRDRTASINYTPSKLPKVSTSEETQNIIKSYEKEQEEKELDRLTKILRTVDGRFPDLMLLDIAIPHNFNIMELDPEDVAIQLTLLDSFVFKKIKKRECIEQSWKKKDKALKAPNILKMIGQFNDVSKWVQLTILSGTTPRLRKRYIKKMISMTSYFMQNGNLSSLCSFYNALTSSNILSLHASWKLLSKSKRKELEEIKNLFGWKMQKFKQMQEDLQPPCIPHIGIILQTLFQIDEGSKQQQHKKQTQINSPSVNYIKMMMLYEQIDNLEILQSKHYRDEPNFLVQKLLIREFRVQSKLTDTHLYKLSKSVSDSEKNQKK